METDLDVSQFLNTIYRYIQLGVHIKAFYSKKYGKFHREIDEVTEFYVDENNQPVTHTIYRKMFEENPVMVKPSKHMIEYLANQNIDITPIIKDLPDEMPNFENSIDDLKDNLDEKPVETKKVEEKKTEAPAPAAPEITSSQPVIQDVPSLSTAPATPAPAPQVVPQAPAAPAVPAAPSTSA